MKQILSSYFMLTRIERVGYAALIALLLVLTIVWQLMPYWVHAPAQNAAENEQMAAAFANYRKTHLAPSEARSDQPVVATSLFTFDPNTLDSIGFLKLGLSIRATKGLMNWRRHGKIFYKKEDLKPLYNLPSEDYERIAPYISIAAVRDSRSTYNTGFAKLPPLPATLDLNTIDSATIVRLNGIGPTLAHKIIDKRKALGGFLRHEQLLEIYKFNDSTFAMLKNRLIINPASVKQIKVNTATMEQLQAHPYIGEKYAKGIIQYRTALKHFNNLQQLRQVPLMNEEIYRKIAPYLVVD